MSLVERAVKRLEETGAAAKGPPPVSLGATEPTPASLIERAIERLEAGGPAQEALSTDLAKRVSDASVHTAERAVPGRSAVRPESAGDAMRVPTSATADRRDVVPAEAVRLDLRALAAAGCIDPDDPESVIANEFRRIKRPLLRACQGRLAAPVDNANRIMVTSSVPGEGKSFVSLNLALSMAMERDLSVVLVDADTTRRSLSKQLGINNRPGLLDLLSGRGIDAGDALLATNIERLVLLPAGAARPHATELLASESMEHLLQALASSGSERIVIVDTPPLLGAPEPAVLATHLGQVIVVVEADRTTRKVLGNALATIQSCPLVTMVLNKASSVEAGYHYYDAGQP